MTEKWRLSRVTSFGSSTISAAATSVASTRLRLRARDGTPRFRSRGTAPTGFVNRAGPALGRDRFAGSGSVRSMDEQAAKRATEAARWLLDAAAEDEGVQLTQTHALARAVVREAAERWPDWWDAELFGPPHREADLALLGELHQGLKRLRLLRRRGRRLHTTARGRELAAEPPALLDALAGDLGAADELGEVVATAIVETLRPSGAHDHEALDQAAAVLAAHRGFRDPDGRLPVGEDLRWEVGEVLRRGKAYGLVGWVLDPELPVRWSGLVALTDAGRVALNAPEPAPLGGPGSGIALVFEVDLLGAEGVGARVAAAAEQHLTALHDAIQTAFGWYDDHLYSFWLDGEFWSSDEVEFTSPIDFGQGSHTADVPLAELDLAVGAPIAYVFDFGDEWRVLLTLTERCPADDGAYPRVLARRGQAPPQYAEPDEGS